MRAVFGVLLATGAAAIRVSPIDDYARYAEVTISFHVPSFGANRVVIGTDYASKLLSSRGKALRHDALGRRVTATIEPPAWTLRLQRDTSAFSDNYFEARLMNNATQATYHVVRQHSPKCIYSGTIHADASSPAIGQAVVSTCGDLWAAVTANGTLYNIQYAEDLDRHVLLNSRDRLVSPAIDNLTMDMLIIPRGEDKTVSRSAALSLTALDARRVPSGPALKRAAVLIVNDNARYSQLGDDVEDDSVAIWSYVQAMYSGLYDPEYFDFDMRVELAGQLTFVQTDPYEIETGSGGEVDIHEVLKKVGLWLKSERPNLEAAQGEHIDDAQLLSGHNFKGNTVGLAWLEGICFDRYALAVNQARAGQQPEKTARIVAHELGHNLGMRHDLYGRNIMAPVVPADPTNQFSTASKEAANDYIKSTRADCLDDYPTVILKYEADSDVGVFIVERKYPEDSCDLIALPNGGTRYITTGIEDFLTRAADLYGRYGRYRFGTVVDEIDREAFVKNKNGKWLAIIKGRGISGSIKYKFPSSDAAETFAAFLNAFIPFMQIAGPNGALCSNLPY